MEPTRVNIIIKYEPPQLCNKVVRTNRPQKDKLFSSAKRVTSKRSERLRNIINGFFLGEPRTHPCYVSWCSTASDQWYHCFFVFGEAQAVQTLGKKKAWMAFLTLRLIIFYSFYKQSGLLQCHDSQKCLRLSWEEYVVSLFFHD